MGGIKKLDVEKEQANESHETKGTIKEKEKSANKSTDDKTDLNSAKKKKAPKTVTKRRTRNAPNTRSLDLKENDNTHGSSKKSNLNKKSTAVVKKGENIPNKDVKSESIQKDQAETDVNQSDVSRKKKVDNQSESEKATTKKKAKVSKIKEEGKRLEINKNFESSNDAPGTSKLKNNKTVESSEPADDLVKSEAKSKQVKKALKLKNKTTNTKLDKLTKQNCTEVLKKKKASSGKQKVE